MNNKEILWEYDACQAGFNLYLFYKLAIEASARINKPISEASIILKPINLAQLKMYMVSLPNPESIEACTDLNPFKIIKNWIPSLDIPDGEVRIETSKGLCRIYNLNHTY